MEGVRALVQHISHPAKNSQIQVLTGDFNAEPQEEAIAFLLSDAEQEGDATMSRNEGERKQRWAPFVDAWEHMRARNRNTEQVDEANAVAEGYTFPACSPVKRIDFIMVRNRTADLSIASAAVPPAVGAEITDFRIVGTRPTTGTGKRILYCCKVCDRSLIIAYSLCDSYLQNTWWGHAKG
jgi:endonuclease/exonuclease/phosphatase family metal-dependent hydrolase